MALFPSYQSYRSVAPSGKNRTVHSRAPSPSIGFRVPRNLPACPGLPVFVPGGGRGQSQQYVRRQPLQYTNEGIEIIDLTGYDRKRPVLELQAAGCGLTRARADDHPTFLRVSHHIDELRETPPESDDDTTLMGDEDSVQQALETTNPQETRDTRTQPPSKSPAWTGTKAPKTSTAGEGGYGDYSNDSDDSGNDLPPLDILMVRAMRKRAMANAGDKPSTTTAERPGGSVGGQEGNPNGEQAATAPVVVGESLDMPIELDDDGDDDNDDSNEDADDEYDDDDGGQDDGSKKTYTAPLYVGSLDARSSPPSEVQIQHYGLPTGDARLEYVLTAPTQAFSPRPEAAFKDNIGPEIGKSSPPSDSVIPSNTEDGLPTEFPPESPTEEASDCIYQDGDNGCREPGHGAVKAPLEDAVRHYRSSASQVPEQTEDPDTPNIVQPTASLISEPAAGGPDYVRRLPKEQLQYAPLRSDARLQYVTEADQHGQQDDMLPHRHQEGKKRRRPSPSPSPTAVENRPRKRHSASKSASQPPHIDENSRMLQTPQGQESNIPIICDGREVKPGDYIVVAYENNGSNDGGRNDLPDIARVDKIRSDGRLNIT